MGYSKKMLDKYKDRILSKETHRERVLESFKVGKELTTDRISQKIREDYKRINESIDSLDNNDPNLTLKVVSLQNLRKNVSKQYSISKREIINLQDLINDILAEKNSNIFRVKLD